ncbi:MAG: 3-phosphoshikimate 1-carboxyvinyltransferase [Proteobacteria bacterium]|nr:3-phosphoshikimate 1-carboxyvinyltransferase [Pseudomonadota bacterium]
MRLRSYKKDIALKGETTVAGDKSISHRSLIFSALAHGKSTISGLLEGEDVLKTAAALRLMGVEIKKCNPNQDSTYWEVSGSGVAGLMEPADILDMGNSGTSSRLMAGLVCPYNFTTFFTGDASLHKRPMRRVFEPINEIGAKVVARQNNLMPFAIIGAGEYAMPISYQMKVASAQVKSCILLAALTIRGTTTIIEPEKCRNHSEIMMRHLGLKISSENFGENGTKISYSGLQEFDAKNFEIPGDISSASFLIVAALLVKNSKIKIKNVGINPLRDGIITTLREMNGNIKITNEREIGGEKVADLIVEYSDLKGIEISASRAPSMIDEYPILAVAAANAKGVTKMNGLAELKVKESNRLLMIAQNLENCGVRLKMGDDYLEVAGGIVQPKNLVKITTAMDHRIAMSFLVMGLTLENGVEIDDSSMIATSFPTFEKIFADFGSAFERIG